VIADEPTTALDVTVQRQILELMTALAREQGTAVLLITHDLGVVAETCDRVAVMYAGRVVETASALELFEAPCHPYTRALLAAVPRLTDPIGGRLPAIPGQPPDILRLPGGCPFHPRCPDATARCAQEEPTVTRYSPEREVRCFHAPPPS
jgi:oligopeptide/dipeptide ABC transporter ATP-binding protein